MNFRIKNPHGVHPPGGWQYQEEGWTAPSPPPDDCRTQTVNISNFRKQNPRLGLSTHLADCEQALFNYTAARLKFHVNWCEGMDDDSKKNSTTPNQPHSSAPAPRAQGVVSRFWDRLKQDVSGLATLARWMGDGGDPVEPAVAATRAQACLKCPHNQPGNAVESKIAAEILEQTSLRKKLNLVVPGESDLRSCELCGCHLPLKVWVPNVGELKGRPPWCWANGSVETQAQKEKAFSTHLDEDSKMDLLVRMETYPKPWVVIIPDISIRRSTWEQAAAGLTGTCFGAGKIRLRLPIIELNLNRIEHVMAAVFWADLVLVSETGPIQVVRELGKPMNVIAESGTSKP